MISEGSSLFVFYYYYYFFFFAIFHSPQKWLQRIKITAVYFPQNFSIVEISVQTNIFFTCGSKILLLPPKTFLFIFYYIILLRLKFPGDDISSETEVNHKIHYRAVRQSEKRHFCDGCHLKHFFSFFFLI